MKKIKCIFCDQEMEAKEKLKGFHICPPLLERLEMDTSKLSQAQLEQALIDNYSYYPITYLSKEDLEEMGFDTDKVNDETMKKIANKMTDIYLDNGFWEDMRLAAEQLGVPMKKGGDKK